MKIERTLIVFKPDSIERGLVGEILSRFEKVGLKIVAAKMVRPSKEHLEKHYEDIGKLKTRRGEKAFNITIKLLQESPVIAIVLEGVEAVSLVRKITGATEPKSALPGTIRGDYSHLSFSYVDSDEIQSYLPNLLHASGDESDAKLEIAHWFSDNEIFDYDILHQKYTQVRSK